MLITLDCEKCGSPYRRDSSRPGRFCSTTCARTRGETRSCVTCGASFYLYPSQVKEINRPGSTATGEFCSKKCYGVRLGERCRGVPLTEDTKRKLSENRTNRGAGIPRKEPIEGHCLQCGVTFTVPRGSAQRQRAKRRFCTKPCWYAYLREHPEASPTFRGGDHPYYGPNWPEQAKRARLRDGHACCDCGATGRRLDVHHLIPRRAFDGDFLRANVLDNLITVCKRCHAARERQMDTAFR